MAKKVTVSVAKKQPQKEETVVKDIPKKLASATKVSSTVKTSPVATDKKVTAINAKAKPQGEKPAQTKPSKPIEKFPVEVKGKENSMIRQDNLKDFDQLANFVRKNPYQVYVLIEEHVGQKLTWVNLLYVNGSHAVAIDKNIDGGVVLDFLFTEDFKVFQLDTKYNARIYLKVAHK